MNREPKNISSFKTHHGVVWPNTHGTHGLDAQRQQAALPLSHLAHAENLKQLGKQFPKNMIMWLYVAPCFLNVFHEKTCAYIYVYIIYNLAFFSLVKASDLGGRTSGDECDERGDGRAYDPAYV